MSADPLGLLLRSFKLPTMAKRYPETLASAQAHGWDRRRFLLALCEAEAADRKERRQERLLKESGLPSGKTLGTLDEEQLPPRIRRQWPTLLDGSFVERAENVLAFGLPGRGKTHFLAVLGRELILRHEYPVFFTPTFKLVQQLLAAKAALKLTNLIQRRDHHRVVILDDIGYVQQEPRGNWKCLSHSWPNVTSDVAS
jgi:DNA replication protein DnaC